MDSTQDKQRSFAQRYFYVVILLPIVFWAFAFPFIKIGLEELSPVNLTILRLFVVCGVFLLFLLLAPKKFTPLQRKDIGLLFLLGFLGVVVYHLGLNYGEQYISASAASLIIATIPIFTVIFATILLKEKVTRKIIIGVPMSLSGVVIISLTGTVGDPFAVTYLTAAFAVLVSAFVGAGYTIAGKKLLVRYSALSLTVYAMLFGCLGLLPFLSSSLVTETLALSLRGWGAVLFLALLPTVVGYVLWYVALEVKTASEISVFLYFIPVLSTIISYVLFNEYISVFFALGGMLVIAGLIVVNWNQSYQQ
ncbi:MAG: DMT family transporter [Candidatus Thermoplasmatota archaeon]|nr:DMT family transporter [Candidatus Thermoplasmatota archaeon]